MKKIMMTVVMTVASVSLFAVQSSAKSNLDSTLKKIWSTVTSKDEKKSPKPEKNDTGPLAKLSEMYKEGQAKFNEKQKELEKEETKPQETTPSVVVFGTKENATFIDDKLNGYEMSLQKLSAAFYDLHEDLEKHLPNLVVDEDFEAEMLKSQMIVDTIKRICTYIEVVDQSVKTIHAGVAILISINSIENESYATGSDNIIKGMTTLAIEKPLLQTIRHEMTLLFPLIQPRHQKIFSKIFDKYAPDIAELKKSFQDIFPTYEKDMQPKIARKDLCELFEKRCENMKDFSEALNVFIDFVGALQKYYAAECSDFTFEMK